MPPLANPYVAGTALGQQHGFFGRDDVFTVVVGSLRSPDQNAVVLFGQRRIGKTSILLQLKRRLPSEEFVPVYFDLMDCAKKPLGRLLYEWAMTIARQIGMPKPDGGSLRALGIEDDDGNRFRERFLPAIYQHLPPGRRPVLLLDEFDVLDVAAEEQLPETAAARSFFPFLRQLLATERRLGFVFVIGRKAEDLSIDARATFKGAIYKRVSVLPPADARQLVGVAERQGSLTILPAAVDRLLHWTSGHPYLAQLLCQVLWERLCIDGMKSARNVEPGDVDAAVPEALQKGEQVFQWIWDGLPAAERVLFSATAVATAKKEWVRQDELLTLLQGHGIRILTRELTLAPDLLVEWEMLRKDADGYRFFVEMLRRWIVENKPLSRVKEELDRIVPEADTLYRGAEVYYRRRDLEGALGQLRNALNVNPNHLKARLRIGGILQEQGHLEAAVVELEHAYRYDEEAARYPLISALFRLGEEGDRLGTPPHGLLPYYQRILAISPGETVAQEHVQALSFRLAEEAQARGDLDGALTLYRRLGAMARVADLEEEKRSLALVALAEEAEALARQGSLHEATDRYLHLAAQDPEGPWASRAERCQRESQLAHCYAEAIGALKLQEWERAQTTFAEITAVRPDYRDAAQRLAYAVVRQRHHGRTGLFGVLIAVRVPFWSQRCWCRLPCLSCLWH